MFEKATSDGVEKMSEKKLGMPRKLPNCVSAPDEYDQMIPGLGGKVKLYPEDLEKMKNMSIDEKVLYIEKLLKAGRYYD